MPKVTLPRSKIIPIPRMNSVTQTLELDTYANGYNSFVANDDLPRKFWRLAQDARINTIGEYETRKGFDFYSEAAGATLDQSVTSVTGASDKAFNTVTWLAQKFTAGTSGNLTRLDINIKNALSATGTVIVELWSNSGSSPGTRIARSSIGASSVLTSNSYLTVRFPDAPAITSTTVYWIVTYVQMVGSGSYSWSATTSASTAQVSTDSGMTWSATSFALNFKQYYATAGAIKGMHRAYKSDGTKKTLMVQGTVLHSVDDVTGALTVVKSGLNASATNYRFVTVNDTVYYINGFDGLRKWDFTTESQVSATNYSLITTHKGLLFLVEVNDPQKLVFSNFGDYETFTSTDFIDVPAPKTGDPVVALKSLNGSLFLPTLNNKFVLSGEDNATFSLDEAPDQHPTFTQETIDSDDNYMYYLAPDGVYRSNGSEPQSISNNIYKEVLQLQNKQNCVLVINKGRLYLWYASAGSSRNDSCWVWNLNYANTSDTVESLDTNAYVSRAVSAFRDDNKLLVASSIVGQVYWQELDSNDTTNLGGDINYLLQTHYETYKTPAVVKQVRFWKPRFGAQSGNYTINCEYAYDYRDNWQLPSNGSAAVQGSGPIWGSGIVWGSFIWGKTAEVQADLYIPGDYRRIAVRYKHFATRQPQKFLGHTFIATIRNIR